MPQEIDIAKIKTLLLEIKDKVDDLSKMILDLPDKIEIKNEPTESI